MSMMANYFKMIHSMLHTVFESEKEYMKQAAYCVAESIQQGGIIQLFGCGHSHLLTEEVFYRSGGLAAIKPIFHEPLMLHEGALRSTVLERKNHYAHEFMKKQEIDQKDIVFVISTSGRNPVPIDVALYAKGKGARVISITSREYASSQPSRHISGKYLFDVADLVIDNHAVKGDAALSHAKVPVSFAPTSTVIGATILNGIFAEAIAIMADNEIDPPLFLSGNLEGSDTHNMTMINRYKRRISLLS